jgi:hypothetical protein
MTYDFWCVKNWEVTHSKRQNESLKFLRRARLLIIILQSTFLKHYTQDSLLSSIICLLLS